MFSWFLITAMIAVHLAHIRESHICFAFFSAMYSYTQTWPPMLPYSWNESHNWDSSQQQPADEYLTVLQSRRPATEQTPCYRADATVRYSNIAWQDDADFQPADEYHSLERFTCLYVQTQQSYRFFEELHSETELLFRQVAHMPLQSLQDTNPWMARCRILLQRIREMIHTKVRCHLHNEKDLWHFRFSNDKANLRKRIRELEVCISRCKETIASLKEDMACVKWERVVKSLLRRHRSA